MDLTEKIVALAKRRGFVYPGSEIYGGIANIWDYGPLGVELKNNIKRLWWKIFVHERDDIIGVETSVIMNSKIWQASGHMKEFADPLIECKNCHSRFRADKLVEESQNLPIRDVCFDYMTKWSLDLKMRLEKHNIELEKKVAELLREKIMIEEKLLERGISPSELGKKIPKKLVRLKRYDSLNKEVDDFLRILDGGIPTFLEYLTSSGSMVCPICNQSNFTHSMNFNLMFKTFLGPVEEKASEAFLRPETAQGMFVNFKNVLDSTRVQLPFGIAQIGKAFRNEISPGNFIFRTREFEQMEIEYFVKAEDWGKYFEYWREQMLVWIDIIGIQKNHIHEREIPEDERAHYSKRTIDFEYDFPFGTEELYGLAYRGDFDLRNHEDHSGANLKYIDLSSGKEFWPHVIEPTWGVDRTLFAVLCNAYKEVKDRVILKLHPKLAPVKVAVFPLLANKPDLVKKAQSIYLELKTQLSQLVVWDDRGNIGKRYFAQDEIGTPFCVTVDFQTLEDNTVTIRDRDTTKQLRVKTKELVDSLREKLEND